MPVDGGGAVRAFWLSRVRDGLRGGRTCPDLFAGGGSPLSLAPQQRPPQPAPGDSDPGHGGGAPLAALRSPGPAAGGRAGAESLAGGSGRGSPADGAAAGADRSLALLGGHSEALPAPAGFLRVGGRGMVRMASDVEKY